MDERRALVRAQGRIVKEYLDALTTCAVGHRNVCMTETIDQRLGAVDDEMAVADAERRSELVQERRELQAERARRLATGGLAALEEAFVQTVAAYSVCVGISYQAWREIGVPSSVLARAAVQRTQ